MPGAARRILFVCEKRAALDVVFHRLKESGLEQLCCLIHDSQTDKKALIQDLKACYERQTSQRDSYDEVAVRQRRSLAALTDALDRFGHVEAALIARPDSLGCTPRQLASRLAGLPPADPAIGPRLRERLPSYAVWCRHRELTQRLQRAVQQRLGLPCLARHPFASLAPSLLETEHLYATAEEHLADCDTLLDTLGETIEDPERLLDGGMLLEAALRLADAAREIVALNLADKLDLLDERSAGVEMLAADFAELARLDAAAARADDLASDWRDPLSPPETEAALALARRFESSFLRHFSSAWRRLARELRQRRDDSRRSPRLSRVRALELLAVSHEATAAATAAAERLRTRLRQRDLAAFQARHAVLLNAVKEPPVARLLARPRRGG
ncbi:MAG: hypothetical protein WDN69_22770 [Aliidongia sp.]